MGYSMYLQQSAGGGDKTDYFRLNIGGMYRWAMPVMRQANMVVECDYQGEWPKPPEDYPEDRIWDDDPRYLAFVGQQVEAPGIPAFKFGSNDGWIVQPDECRSAIAQWEKHGRPVPDTDRDYWYAWIAFLKRAVDHGGFRVW